MDITIVDRRGRELDHGQIQILLQRELTYARANDPAQVLERLQQQAHRAWASLAPCPPELFWESNKTRFINRYIALHI